MGKIVIDGYFGNKFVSVFNRTFTHAPPMIEAETEILGESHCRIGYWLADKWRLPRPICEAILYHHDFPPTDSSAAIEDARLVALCYIAEAICGRHGIGWDGDSACAEVEKESVWKVLLAHQTTYTVRDIDSLIGEVVQAYKDAPPVMLWD
jgi:HD-like signal output (HDOD) protein